MNQMNMKNNDLMGQQTNMIPNIEMNPQMMNNPMGMNPLSNSQMMNNPMGMKYTLRITNKLGNENNQLVNEKNQQKKENSQLKNENSQLKNEKNYLENENSQLKNENYKLKKENDELRNENYKLKRKIEILERENIRKNKENNLKKEKDISSSNNANDNNDFKFEGYDARQTNINNCYSYENISDLKLKVLENQKKMSKKLEYVPAQLEKNNINNNYIKKINRVISIENIKLNRLLEDMCIYGKVVKEEIKIKKIH